MDPFNTVIMELIAEDDRRRRLEQPHVVATAPTPPRSAPGGLRRAFAAMVVRLGLRLHPAAGEGLLTLERAGERSARS